MALRGIALRSTAAASNEWLTIRRPLRRTRVLLPLAPVGAPRPRRSASALPPVVPPIERARAEVRLVRGDPLDGLLGARDALLGQFFDLDDRNGQRRLGVDAPDRRAGDLNPLHRLLRHRRHGNAAAERNHQARTELGSLQHQTSPGDRKSGSIDLGLRAPCPPLGEGGRTGDAFRLSLHCHGGLAEARRDRPEIFAKQTQSRLL